jgi:dolichyl-phosphate-mannose-protein mannosyltransferase
MTTLAPAPPGVVPSEDFDDLLADTDPGITTATVPGTGPVPAATVVPIGELPPLIPPVHPARSGWPVLPLDGLRGWAVTFIITAVGAVVRFWQLGFRTDGGTPIFDEKYYALNSWEVLNDGGYEANPAYGVVVHPPLGKQIIAIGEWLFGYNATGWRFMTAVGGVLCIAIIIRIVRRMTGSTFIGGLAGILLIADGVSHVQSRTGLLDMIQAFFVLAGFACVVADRDQVRVRLHAAVADGSIEKHWAGPALGARWWRFSAGVLFGCATAVKWSGLYYFVVFGVVVVIWDITARRGAGITKSLRAVLRRDFLPSLWALGVVPILVYVGSWWAWFASETAWARHLTDNVFTSFLKWQAQMLKFHANLLTPVLVSSRHPWESKPWSWPIGTRPVLYYVQGGVDATGCDGATDCVKRIFLIGTPAMWWLALPVLFWSLWRTFGRQDWRYAVVVVGYAAGYLPWFFNINRQMYFFYMTPVAPFLVIAIALILGDILAKRTAGIERQLLALAVVCIYVGLVVANFAFLWPILNGDPITNAQLTARIWLPTWG